MRYFPLSSPFAHVWLTHLTIDPDLIMCRKQQGIAIGRLCERHDGICCVCDSYVRPYTLVRICDECNYGVQEGKCVVCGGVGISDAYYCKECTLLEKDRDGCPKIVNIGTSKTEYVVVYLHLQYIYHGILQ